MAKQDFRCRTSINNPSWVTWVSITADVTIKNEYDSTEKVEETHISVAGFYCLIFRLNIPLVSAQVCQYNFIPFKIKAHQVILAPQNEFMSSVHTNSEFLCLRVFIIWITHTFTLKSIIRVFWLGRLHLKHVINVLIMIVIHYFNLFSNAR